MTTTARTSIVVALAVSSSLGCRSGAAAGGAAGRLTNVSCESRAAVGARCASLTVFENRAANSGRTIRIWIVVLPAFDGMPARDPVFFLAGGPGQAAGELLRFPEYGQSSLRRTRDLVFVDQRGTGQSNGLLCEFYGPPEEPGTYFHPFLPLDKVRACRDRLQRSSDLTQYTTAASVEDLEQVRAALGYERINLVGSSYGTRLAMEYVRRYEARVRAVILDGAVAPSTFVPEGFGQSAQRSLDALFQECASTAECASAFPDIRREAREVFERLDRGPVEATVTHPDAGRPGRVTLTRDHVAEVIRYMMYTSRSAARVPLYLHAASKGDYTPIAEFLIRRRRAGTFEALYLSITCAEDVPFLSSDADARDAPTYLGSYRVREQRAACAEWPRGAAPDSRGRPVSSSVPALITSGTLDPVTPPEEADKVAHALSRSRHVRIPYGGHSPAGLVGLDCLERLRTQFIERGDVEGLDDGCVSHIWRPSFATSR